MPLLRGFPRTVLPHLGVKDVLNAITHDSCSSGGSADVWDGCRQTLKLVCLELIHLSFCVSDVAGSLKLTSSLWRMRGTWRSRLSGKRRAAGQQENEVPATS